MRKRKIYTQQKDNFEAEHSHQNNSKTQSIDKKFKSNSTPNRKTISCQQIQSKTTRIVNDNLISTIHPKRTTMNLSSFIQVFRKKVRQTTIAKQFENSLEKFDSLTSNRTLTIQRQKGGFVGSFKKQNQLMVQNNIFDNKLKKVIISDLEYKDKKLNTRTNYSQDFMERLTAKKQFLMHQDKGQRLSRNSRKRILTYTNGDYQDPQSHTISFYKSKFQAEDYGQNPQTRNLNFSPNNDEDKHKNYIQNSNKSSVVFTNRRLDTLNSYQRPNLMYNLSLYRKKNTCKVLRKSQKKLVQNYKSKVLQK